MREARNQLVYNDVSLLFIYFLSRNDFSRRSVRIKRFLIAIICPRLYFLSILCFWIYPLPVFYLMSKTLPSITCHVFKFHVFTNIWKRSTISWKFFGISIAIYNWIFNWYFTIFYKGFKSRCELSEVNILYILWTTSTHLPIQLKLLINKKLFV